MSSIVESKVGFPIPHAPNCLIPAPPPSLAPLFTFSCSTAAEIFFNEGCRRSGRLSKSHLALQLSALSPDLMQTNIHYGPGQTRPGPLFLEDKATPATEHQIRPHLSCTQCAEQGTRPLTQFAIGSFGRGRNLRQWVRIEGAILSHDVGRRGGGAKQGHKGKRRVDFAGMGI